MAIVERSDQLSRPLRINDADRALEPFVHTYLLGLLCSTYTL